jgi:hypothetical protein
VTGPGGGAIRTEGDHQVARRIATSCQWTWSTSDAVMDFPSKGCQLGVIRAYDYRKRDSGRGRVEFKNWWTRGESNPRPSECHAQLDPSTRVRQSSFRIHT